MLNGWHNVKYSEKHVLRETKAGNLSSYMYKDWAIEPRITCFLPKFKSNFTFFVFIPGYPRG